MYSVASEEVMFKEMLTMVLVLSAKVPIPNNVDLNFILYKFTRI